MERLRSRIAQAVDTNATTTPTRVFDQLGSRVAKAHNAFTLENVELTFLERPLFYVGGHYVTFLGLVAFAAFSRQALSSHDFTKRCRSPLF